MKASEVMLSGLMRVSVFAHIHALLHFSTYVCMCVCVCICVSWFCKLTLGCSRVDLSEQLKEDFCWICGPNDIINCTVRLRQSFPQSSSRVHPCPSFLAQIEWLISGQTPPAFPPASSLFRSTLSIHSISFY